LHIGHECEVRVFFKDAIVVAVEVQTAARPVASRRAGGGKIQIGISGLYRTRLKSIGPVLES